MWLGQRQLWHCQHARETCDKEASLVLPSELVTQSAHLFDQAECYALVLQVLDRRCSIVIHGCH